MNQRIKNLYDFECDSCNEILSHSNLSFDKKSKYFQSILKAVETSFKALHGKGSYKPEDIKNTQEYKDLISSTNSILSEVLIDNDIPKVMLKALENDIFLFSALKTHAQLFEASRLLLDENKQIKPFYKFAQDVSAIKKNYNEFYLEAEYVFATSSAQMASKWADVEENNGRYNLQYRTAKDEKVRDSHRALDETTLPADDDFWNKYYPPNGWRCRCNAVEVLKDKYDISDSKKAIENGEAATSLIGKDGKNKLEIFRFNPGKEKVIFPPKHPYHKLAGASNVKNIVQTLQEENKKEIVNSRNLTKAWSKEKIKNEPITLKIGIKQLDDILLSRSNVKTIVSKGHDFPILRDNFIRNIQSELKKGKYVGWDEDELVNGVQKHLDVDYWKYFEIEIGGEKSYLNVKVLNKGGNAPYAIENEKDFKTKKIKKGTPKR